MGTKNTTTTTNQYAPSGMQTYNALQGPAANVMGGNISNPYGNTFFQGQQYAGGLANAGFGASAGASNRQATSALGTPMTGSYNAASGAAQTRSNLMNSARMNNSLLLGAAQNRQTSLGSAMNYRPLQIGGKSVEQTSGTGTWLTPLIGAGLSVAGSFMGDPMLGKQVMGATGHGSAGTFSMGGFGGGQQGGGYFGSSPNTYQNSLSNSSSGFDAMGNALSY